ncbi:ABC transporter substrate-binding protein [Dickeya dianthicola]|nr:ABC transporter substrate-binding protein [Dickeya dianthicola]MCI4186800.1 ABC transporter substrate-binding protein [Dickeya dianthicola]
MNLRTLTRVVLVSCVFTSFATRAVAEETSISVAVQSMGKAGSLEAVDNNSTAARKYQNSIFEQLIALDLQDPNLSLKAGLAKEWKWINDKTLELKLREGVKFHNGDTMTAEDVAFSFSDERFGCLPEQTAARDKGETTFKRADGTTGIIPPATVAASRETEWPMLDHVEVVDTSTVRFIMKAASFDTLLRLARLNYASIISKRGFMEAASWNAWAAKPIGTGPYKVDRLEPGNAIRLSANQNYWGGKPPIDKLNILVIPEAASRVNGLLSGEYDIVTDVGPDQIQLVEQSDHFNIVGVPVANIRFIALDETKGPLKNLKVRKALTHAIDRKTIVDALWNNRTAVPQGFQHPMFGDLFATDHKTPEYNPGLAKKLLTESGYKGERIAYRVHPDYYPNELNVAQYNLENLRATGFNIDFSVTEKANDPGPDRMMQDLSNTVYFAAPIAILSNNCPGGTYNTKTNPKSGMWQNDEFDKLCKVLETSTDRIEIKKSFTRALDIIENDDPGIIVLHQNIILYGKRSNIEWSPSAMFAMDFSPGHFAIKNK